MTTLHGRISAVYIDTTGDFLLSDPSGQGTVALQDATPFAEDGGTASILDEDGTVLTTFTYLSADWDTNILDVSGNVAAGTYPAGLAVRRNPTQTTMRASITPDDTESGPITARVPYAIRSHLADGIRQMGQEEEAVVDLIRGKWVLIDIPGAVPG